PADQSSWDVYSKLEAANEQYLWGLLQTASQGGASRTPAQQKIGDYFGACMDEAAADRLGTKPIAAELAQIAAMKSIADLPAFLGKLHLTVDASDVAFAFGADQDAQDSEQVIAQAYAGGL